MKGSARPRLGGWVAVGILAALVVADRWAWAGLAEWGGDAGLVLGLAREGASPVGMLNSHNDPNPNGLVILGSAILAIGDLRVASLALSLSQALAACWLASGLTRRRDDALLVAQPLLWCGSLRAVSTEFWAQWILITLGTISVAALLHHLRRPRVRFLVVSWGAAWVSASAYLPGLVSLCVVSLLWVARLMDLPRAERRRHLMQGVAPVSLFFAAVVVLPFLGAVNVLELSPGTGRGLLKRLVHGAVEPLRALPALFSFLRHSFPRSLRPAAAGLSLPDTFILGSAFALTVFAALSTRHRPLNLGSAALRYALGFLLGIFAASPVLTGYALSRDGRLDQALQTVPALLALAFSGPLVLGARGQAGDRAALIARVLAVLFALSQAFQGASVREAIAAGHTLTYGPHLGEVRAVVSRLAGELRPGDSTRSLSIEYGGTPWFVDFLRLHERWHKAPMTSGEVFDHELAFLAGVRNACLPDCPLSAPRYRVDWGDTPSKRGTLIWTSPNGRIRIERIGLP